MSHRVIASFCHMVKRKEYKGFLFEVLNQSVSLWFYFEAVASTDGTISWLLVLTWLNNSSRNS